MAALTDRETHYDFGENWARFAEGVDEKNIANAVAGLAKLVGDDLAGKSFLEVGCGSGIHSLAALRLGAASVLAIDIDPRAVETTEALLHRHAPGGAWRAETRSIFDVTAGAGASDVVYSWGVLHHTGDMKGAIACAASLVAPGGRLVLALYRKTPMCRFWRIEKRLYAHGPRWHRRVAEGWFAALMVAGLLATGRNPARYIRDYPQRRGMTFITDVRDWLGGYPYDSARPAEVTALLSPFGFSLQRFFPCNTRIGLLGVGCDEYVFAAGSPKTAG